MCYCLTCRQDFTDDLGSVTRVQVQGVEVISAPKVTWRQRFETASMTVPPQHIGGSYISIADDRTGPEAEAERSDATNNTQTGSPSGGTVHIATRRSAAAIQRGLSILVLRPRMPAGCSVGGGSNVGGCTAGVSGCRVA